MLGRRALLSGLVIALVATHAAAIDVPRSARLVKDAGNSFLSAKKYADAIDCYFQALDLYPEFPEAHYNLAVAFLKGYKAHALALHHFEQYLQLAPGAPDRETVAALSAALRERLAPVPARAGQVVTVIGGRLLLSGAGWAKKGDRVEVAEQGTAPCALLLAEYVYDQCVLTQRIWDEETLDRIQPGYVAMNASERLLP